MKRVIFCIFYHCTLHPSELWPNHFSFPLLPVCLQVSFLWSLTLHIKSHFTPSYLGKVSVFLSCISDFMNEINLLWIFSLHLNPVRSSLGSLPSATPAQLLHIRMVPFCALMRVSRKIRHVSCVLSPCRDPPMRFQQLFHWKIFSSSEIGIDRIRPPHFSYDLKFIHLPVADMVIADADSDYC